MRLISSKQAKRRTALMFALALVLSNLLSLVGPSANAAVTITSPSAGTCFQHSGTVANGANVTVYSLGSVQISLTASEITPGQDAAGAQGATTGIARATLAGSISTNSDVIGNVFSIIPPTGTNFVIVPGFQDTTTGSSSNLSGAGATIANAVSSDGSTGAGTPDGNLGISVGVVTAGTAGIGRAIVAIARDGDSTGGGAGSETYPKSNTGSNTASITINGLGLAVPPSGEGALSGTLQASLDATPPSGIGLSGGVTTPAVSSAIPGLTGTINICTITSSAGQLEAVLDSDDDANENYDKSGTTSPNLVALGSISSNSRVWIFDTATLATGVSGTSLLDTEPILIRGTAGTGTATRDQVFATGSLLNDITSTAFAPNGTALDLASNFGNSVVAPITVSFADDNASAATSLKAVSVIIAPSTTGAAPAATGYNAAQTSRTGFLGALRAALFDTTSNATNNQFNIGGSWGIGSVSGGPGGVAAQETNLASANAMGIAALGTITGNATEPFNNTFLDLRLECGTTTNPVTGWFAILNSADVAGNFSTTTEGNVIRASQGGHKFLVNSATNLFSQALTNIAGSNPVTARSFRLATWTAAMNTTATGGNALLYASCSNNTLTLLPIQNGFDATRDIIAVTPFLEVTNVTNTFASDVQVVAQISGNNLTGTTTLNLAKLVGVPTTGGTSTLAAATGVALAENSGVGLNCTSGGTSSVVLSGVSTGTFDAAVSAACTSGSVATPPPVFTGGVGTSVVAGQVVDGSPVVQGEGRGILIKELNATGFNELVSQIGGGTQGTVFEVQLPSACDVIDDRDDNNTAASTVSGAGGNDGSKFTVTSTAGVTAAFTNGGTGDAALTSSNVIEPVSGANPARVRFRLTTVGGTTDAATTDAVLVRIDSQDLFCNSSVTGDLTAKVFAQNKVTSPTITSSLGTVNLGTAKSAFTFAFADDVATSTKGETSTNTMIGSTPRLAGGSTSTSHRISIVEGDAKSIPIGGRVASRNLDPDNSVLSTVLTRGQIWIVPASGSAFSAAPTAADVSFSDNSLVTDGNPVLVTSATIDANAPLGTVIVGVKRNTASGAADPTTSTTTITVKNLKLASASSSTTDLISSLQFFSQDAGVVVNVPGIASGNSSSTPTVFTPFAPGSTKASTQLNVVAASAVQLGSGSLANALLTDRLMSASAPQLNPFAKVITSAKNADSSKIAVSSSAVTSGGTPATDTVVTVTGTAGAVDGGAEVVVTTGSTTYDTTTVVASDDGSFTAKLRGDCSGSNTSVSVSVKEQVSGTATTSVTKTALCSGGGSGQTAAQVAAEIAGADGVATVAEVLSFVASKGGLAAVISLGGATLDGVILAIKQALGLS